MANRFNSGYKIDSTKFMDIKKYEQYAVAKNIFTEISCYSYFAVEESEVMAFALLLLFVTDIQPDYELSKYQDLYKKSLNINHFIESSLNDFLGIRVSDFIDSTNIFSNVTIMLAAGIKYNTFVFFNNSNLYRFSSRNMPLFNPITFFIAKYIALLFEKTYNYTVCDYYITNLSLCFEQILKKIKYVRKKLNVVVFDVRGINKANIIKYYLSSIFNNCFSSIKIYELYELRKINLKEVDFVIGNAPRFTFKYDIDYIFVNNILDKESIAVIYDYIFKNSFCIDKYIPDFDSVNYYLDYDYINEEAFVKIISNKYSNDSIAEKSIEKYLTMDLFTCVSGFLVIFIPINYTKKSFIDFYSLKKSNCWKNNNVEKILILSADISNKFLFKFVCDLSSIFINKGEDIAFYLDEKTFNKQFLSNLIKKYCIY